MHVEKPLLPGTNARRNKAHVHFPGPARVEGILWFEHNYLCNHLGAVQPRSVKWPDPP